MRKNVSADESDTACWRSIEVGCARTSAGFSLAHSLALALALSLSLSHSLSLSLSLSQARLDPLCWMTLIVHSSAKT